MQELPVMVALEILQSDVLTAYPKTGIDNREIFMRMPTYIVQSGMTGLIKEELYGLQ